MNWRRERVAEWLIELIQSIMKQWAAWGKERNGAERSVMNGMNEAGSRMPRRNFFEWNLWNEKKWSSCLLSSTKTKIKIFIFISERIEGIKMYYNSKYNEIKDKSIQQFLKIWRIEEIEWIELLNDWVMLAGQPKETVQWINEWTKWKKLIYCCFRGGSVIWFLWWVGCSFLWWVMPAAGGMGLRQREGTATSNPSMKAMELKAKQREWNEWKKREEMNGMELN